MDQQGSNPALQAGSTAVIADTHPMWLDALEVVLARLDVEVVGRTTHGDEVDALIDALRPDVVVTEYSIAAGKTHSGVNGDTTALPLLRRARGANPNVKCIVLADQDNEENREAAFASGAAVFCVKKAESDDLAVAIRQCFEQSIYFANTTPRASERVEDRFDSAGVSSLTKRELEILRLAAEGHSNAQLAKTLWVTEQTVKFHLSNIYRKLEVANRTEASRWAQVHGLLRGPVAEPSAA